MAFMVTGLISQTSKSIRYFPRGPSQAHKSLIYITSTAPIGHFYEALLCKTVKQIGAKSKENSTMQWMPAGERKLQANQAVYHHQSK